MEKDLTQNKSLIKRIVICNTGMSYPFAVMDSHINANSRRSFEKKHTETRSKRSGEG